MFINTELPCILCLFSRSSHSWKQNHAIDITSYLLFVELSLFTHGNKANAYKNYLAYFICWSSFIRGNKSVMQKSVRIFCSSSKSFSYNDANSYRLPFVLFVQFVFTLVETKLTFIESTLYHFFALLVMKRGNN